ncbi:pyridoxamine 5-phosphate oxidase [Pontibacillus halophilus JSM 076056 = DSM 19796]|uniref:Pyridoxamine 5-phosphate oxidase n=1 Tax=Pontibacillus halophilus JSM 076056 = DSM 19796 TaxID=1385510 RepID=A0A0A5HW74_9BACI|nr:pyridoxamine 5'-phosphate oxidase family protein [Pontibacillus halophilus]KGX87887.1 pyridoxamine 5-phosphate oxidase [Pontibacillus halophilus JSM 076056 = DSM 19796]
MEIIKGERSFDLDKFLEKPLFAHLSTSSPEGPRDSPVWFLWEDKCLWIIGTPGDTFPLRIKEQPSCAIGIVDFDPGTGKVLHAGFRGKATVESFDSSLAKRLFTKYLGPNENNWDCRFKDQDPNNVLIRFAPETVVVRDQSYNVDES